MYNVINTLTGKTIRADLTRVEAEEFLAAVRNPYFEIAS
jgi:hypothetical protein